MANERTDALSILMAAETKAKLNEIQAGIVENIQKQGNSFRFKSQNANLGAANAGSFEFKRFTNSESKEYGTARKNGKGDKLTAPATTVNLDIHREIVEEVSGFDVNRFGLDSSLIAVATKRKANHQSTLQYETESAFWRTAYLAALNGGIVAVGYNSKASETFDDQIEQNAIVPLETVKNSYVRGVPRNLIGGVLRPGAYSKLKTQLNKMYNANFSIADEELQGINGVSLFSEPFLPAKVDGIVMVKESVAQPLSVREYGAEKIPLSDDYALELFYDYGVKDLAPDLILVMVQLDDTHTKAVAVDKLPTSGQAADTVYLMKKASDAYNASTDISSTNYPAGTMFTYAGSAWTQYNK